MDTPADRRSEAGFTLIEAMTAIVVLLVGITSVANLLAVAASSNSVGNQTTAAAAIASREMERLQALPFDELPVGGDVETDVPPDFVRDDELPGVGNIHTRWQVTAIGADTRFIRVRSEGTGALSGPRSRAEFTTVRSCTVRTIGCP